jgi:hypothetical protein
MEMSEITVGTRVRLTEEVQRDVADAPAGAEGTVVDHDTDYGLVSVRLDESIDGLERNEIQWSGLGIGMWEAEYLAAAQQLETI